MKGAHILIFIGGIAIVLGFLLCFAFIGFTNPNVKKCPLYSGKQGKKTYISSKTTRGKCTSKDNYNECRRKSHTRSAYFICKYQIMIINATNYTKFVEKSINVKPKNMEIKTSVILGFAIGVGVPIFMCWCIGFLLIVFGSINLDPNVNFTNSESFTNSRQRFIIPGVL